VKHVTRNPLGRCLLVCAMQIVRCSFSKSVLWRQFRILGVGRSQVTCGVELLWFGESDNGERQPG
jgi:hypothetical protein